MIESIITFSCRNKAVVILAFVGLTAIGLCIVSRTPVDAIQEISSILG